MASGNGNFRHMESGVEAPSRAATSPSKPSRKMHHCSVCRHPGRLQIELLRLSGMSLDKIAARYPGISRDSIHRHMVALSDVERTALLADLPMKQLAMQAAEEGVALLDYLKIIRTQIMRQLLLAANDGDRVGTASLAGRAIECLRELGKLTGEISNLTSYTVNNNTAVFVNSPEYAALETMLIERLAKYPDALSAVVDGLRQLEDSSSVPEGRRQPTIAYQQSVQP
jgi:hypothetical protein